MGGHTGHWGNEEEPRVPGDWHSSANRGQPEERPSRAVVPRCHHRPTMHRWLRLPSPHAGRLGASVVECDRAILYCPLLGAPNVQQQVQNGTVHVLWPHGPLQAGILWESAYVRLAARHVVTLREVRKSDLIFVVEYFTLLSALGLVRLAHTPSEAHPPPQQVGMGEHTRA